MTERDSTTDTRPVGDDDLALFFSMHKAIRAHLASFVRIVPETAPPEASRRAALARWFAFKQRAIHAHHEGEDAKVYPKILARDPSFAGELAVLQADHAELDPLLARVASGLAGGAMVGPDLRRLERLMREHLDREEAAIVDRMKRTLTLADMDEIERDGAKTTSLSDLSRIIPWVMAYADARERRLLEDVLPWPVKLLHRLSWRPRYERLASFLEAA
jgi:hypothetical protein